MSRLPPELANARRADGDDPIVRLGQAANIAEIDELGSGEWTTLYESSGNKENKRFAYTALMAPALVEDALKRAAWEVRIGDDSPGFSKRDDNGVEVTVYERFSYSGLEPILYLRNFHGIKPQQFDLSEEFRLFHNLYHDRAEDRYIHIDGRGNEIVAAEIGGAHARVLTRLVRQYMAARQLALVLYFERLAFAKVDVEAVRSAVSAVNVATADRSYSLGIGQASDGSISRLVGKKIITPPPVNESGIWPYEFNRNGEHESFIIGVAEDGSPTFHTCDPNALSDYFVTKGDAAHYLTPVWFSRDVLTKYYNDPKFSVEDGYLRCGSLWGLQIDNNIPDHIVVYLGDLGRDLDPEEQKYWRHFNIPPGDRRPSETNFKRSFGGEFAEPSAPDLLFKLRYTQLIESWKERFHWELYRPAHEADAHILGQLRVPLSETFGEFDTQLLYLVKLLVDALNEPELVNAAGESSRDEKGISKFKRFLEHGQYPHVDRDVSLLRTLQDLRSSGAAHHKGSRFDKVSNSVGLDRNSPRDIFRGLLAQANTMLTDLAAHFIH
jgi:hypothetical protein